MNLKITKTKMLLRIYSLIFFALLTRKSTLVMAYSTGAPISTCDTLTPLHKNTAPQSSASPYKITVAKNTVEAEGRLNVTLSSASGDHFKGFLLKAVPVGANAGVAGSFLIANNQLYQPLSCSQIEQSAVTHTSSDPKTAITLTWVAPPFSGTYEFVGTAVRSKDTYWTSIKSSDTVTVTGGRMAGFPSATPTETPKLSYNYSDCGSRISCMGFPSGCVSTHSCRILLTFQLSADKRSVDFELISNVPPNNYIAMGLSTDKYMGDDSVLECLSTPNGVKMFASINKGMSNVKVDGNSQHLTPKRLTHVDGTLSCSFSRAMKTIVGGLATDMSTSQYHILLVRGPLNYDNTDIAYHTNRMASASSFDVSSPNYVIVLGGDIPVRPEIIIHGSLMVVAWIGTASIAIFLARYYKDMWPEKTHCKVKIWFAWHRGLNILTVLLTVAAFILIFVTTGITDLWKHNAHPILGTVTVALMLLQPIGALFRPNPGTPKRPIFNWLHYLGGMLACVCAVITMFFAVTLKVAQLPTYFWWILIAFVAFYVLLFLVMEFFTCLSNRKAEKEVIPLKDFNGHDGPFNVVNQLERQGTRFKQVMLILFSVGVIGFTAALVTLIAT